MFERQANQMTVRGIQYPGALVAAAGDYPPSFRVEGSEKYGVCVSTERKLEFAGLRIPNPSDIVLTTGDNTQTVRAEIGTKNLLRMLQGEDLGAITYPPDAGCFVTACGNDQIAVRAAATP
jgi:hypothetical protein